MLQNHLKELGLTDNEVKIYLLLLENGLLSASDIASKLSFHRGYVYDVLERMLEKEFVSTLNKDGKKHFQASTPEQILELLKVRMLGFQKIVPELKQMSETSTEETRVDLYKGKHVFRTLIKDVLIHMKKNSEVLIYGIDEDRMVLQVEPILIKQYFNRLKENKIRERVIIKKGSYRFENSFTEYKEIDEKYVGNTTYFVYANKVATFILGTPHYMILVENEEVAKTYRKQFELMWKNSSN